MFNTTCPGNDQKDETHFHAAVSCIAGSLKTQIISRSYDQFASLTLTCLFAEIVLISVCLFRPVDIGKTWTSFHQIDESLESQLTFSL
ncbi:hypothetical protein GOBAR_DD09941 [Gossypium barbadense]|nr:hypothetical protein GOBAR_DD09941 [Gossypium barbadense]